MVIVQRYKHDGIFIAKRNNNLCTKSMVPSESVYGEKRLTIKYGRPQDTGGGLNSRGWHQGSNQMMVHAWTPRAPDQAATHPLGSLATEGDMWWQAEQQWLTLSIAKRR